MHGGCTTCEKGTRQAVDFCKAHKVGSVFVGNPDGVRRKTCGRHHNQRLSQWGYGKGIDYLQQKSEKDCIVRCGPHGPCFTGDERGTSSRHCRPQGCPVCGHRHKPKGRTGSARNAAFRATGMSSAASTRTRRRLVKWCRFRTASRIPVREASGGVVARARAFRRSMAEVVWPNRGIKRRNEPSRCGFLPGTAHEPRVLARSSPA